MPKDYLEQRVMEELGDVLGLRYTSGSGNQLGDGDLKPNHYDVDAPITFGFECKRTTKSKSHSVKWDEWTKAKKQISKQGHTPIMVTQNSEHTVMVHMEMDTFVQLLTLLDEFQNKE